jgi:hypothetical protein
MDMESINPIHLQWLAENCPQTLKAITPSAGDSEDLKSCCQRLEQENYDLKQKADMLDTILSCERIRVLGYAQTDENGTKGAIQHIGLELWRKFPENDDTVSRETVMKFLKQDLNVSQRSDSGKS